jgi:predicted RNA-binding Zn-ribbon protein involved in translation (DUF1610 family)
MKCLGCGQDIPWDGKTMFCYTCPCGATIFIQEENLYPPASLVTKISNRQELSHLDYYLGKSNYTSPEKEDFYKLLRKLGATWSWECPDCKEGFLQRTKMEVENNLYPLQLHPELAKILKEA